MSHNLKKEWQATRFDKESTIYKQWELSGGDELYAAKKNINGVAWHVELAKELTPSVAVTEAE